MSARRYRVPTHLTVEPSLLRAELGPFPVDLTFRQATALALAAGFSYGLWQGSGLPSALVVSLALAALLLALTAAFVRVGGRSADLWLRDLLRYLVRPHRLAWRSSVALASDLNDAAWAEQPLPLAWAPRPSRHSTPSYPREPTPTAGSPDTLEEAS